MKKPQEIIKAIEAITSGRKITTASGEFSVVGVSRADRMILAEDQAGEIHKIFPFAVESIQQTARVNQVTYQKGETEK